ncbi:hypothetical protein D3C75_1190820 [compost metagenome]
MGGFERACGLYKLKYPFITQQPAYEQKVRLRWQWGHRVAFSVDPRTIDDPGWKVGIEKSLILEELSVIRILEEQSIGKA